MASSKVIISLGCLVVVLGAICAAPVKEQAEKKSQNVEEVQGEDEDLQELLQLVHNEAEKDDVMVHKEHVTHIENNNGKSVKVEQKEEKVVDTNTGAVVADVKQEVKTDSVSGVEPQTVVETEVDVPAEGVHEAFLQQGDENADPLVDDESPAKEESDSDFKPADIAAYLFATQQFDAFYAAMDRLVNESRMSAEDAAAYTKAVAMEYEQLQLQDLENRFIYEGRSSYPQLGESDLYGATGYDIYPQQELDVAEPSFDMLNYVNSLVGPEDDEYLAAQRQPSTDLLLDAIDPYQFVSTLWSEAYENGNEDAQEIVRMLYDRVSHDSNPDDMGEIRDILLDTVAESLEDTPYSLDTPIDAPLALPEMPVNQLEVEPENKMPVDNAESIVEEAKRNTQDEEEEQLSAVANGQIAKEEETKAEAVGKDEENKEEEKEESNDAASPKEEDQKER